MSSVPVSTKGQVVIPLPIRTALGLEPGTKVEITLEGRSARLRPVEGRKRIGLEVIQRRLAPYRKRVPVSAMTVSDYRD